MPAYDRFHGAVKNALIKDGWTVTDDPLHLKYAGTDLYVDLAAERIISAEKGRHKIAVEIKTFAGCSELRDLHQAVGQYVVYRSVLAKSEPDRELFLAVSEAVYQDVFVDSLGELLLQEQITRLITFSPEREEIVRWVPQP